MIDAAGVLLLISMFAISAPAIDRALSHRRHAQTEMFDVALKRAFPFTPPSPPLDALVRQAEDALDRDSLSRGITDTAATYDGAADCSHNTET